MATTNEYTIENWISKFRDETNTVSDFNMKFAISNGSQIALFMEESVLSKYNFELERYVVRATLTQREQEFYAYNPRLFAYNLYGIPEYWFLVLYANEMHSAMEFNVKKIRFYKPSVTSLLNAIRIAETPYKDNNEQEMSNVIVNGTSVNSDVNISVI